MSKVIVGEIEGPSTTSNKITIASGSQLDIAGSPGGSGAINLAVDGGDITTGTVANARLAAGHVVQVVTGTMAGGTSTTSTGAFIDIGCEVTITPQVSGNKILITTNWNPRVFAPVGNDATGYGRLLVGTTSLSSIYIGSDNLGKLGDSVWLPVCFPFNFLYTTTSGTAHTFKLQCKSGAGAFAYDYNGGVITAMEIQV
jgi:hypothetical protein